MRGAPLERACARVCREAGARVAQGRGKPFNLLELPTNLTGTDYDVFGKWLALTEVTWLLPPFPAQTLNNTFGSIQQVLDALL